MKILLSRVKRAVVASFETGKSSVNKGLVLFVAIEKSDVEKDLLKMSNKILNLRVFENEAKKMHFSIKDLNYQILCVSNFTLCARTKNGRRPSFDDAMEPEKADKLFNDFVKLLSLSGLDVRIGFFGMNMQINLDLDGPVNIYIDSKQ